MPNWRQRKRYTPKRYWEPLRDRTSDFDIFCEILICSLTFNYSFFINSYKAQEEAAKKEAEEKAKAEKKENGEEEEEVNDMAVL